MKAARLAPALLLALAGCTFGRLDPPCRTDDNCAAPLRCDVDTATCVLDGDGADGGAPDGGAAGQ